jgi:hypothetical protein
MADRVATDREGTTMDRPTTAERALRAALRILGALLVLAALAYALPPLWGDAFFAELPFVANSAAKVALLGLAALYAAGDVRRRRGVVAIVIGAHLVSVAAMGVALAFGETGREVDVPLFGEQTIEAVLWGAIVLDGVITALVGGLCAWACAQASPAPGRDPRIPTEPLAPAERRLRLLLVAGLLPMLAAGGAVYLGGALLDGTQDAFRELPFVTNSVVKVAGIALLCGYVARDVRGNLPLAGPAIVALLLGPLVDLVYLIFLDTGRPFPLFDWEPTVGAALWAVLAIDAAGGLALLLAVRAAWTAHERIAFLSPLQQRGLLALAQTLVAPPAGQQAQVGPRAIAANVEGYVKEIRARRTWVYRFALMAVELRPLLRAWPPLSEIEPHERRRFLERRFLKPPPWPRFAKNLTQVVIRIGQ